MTLKCLVTRMDVRQLEAWLSRVTERTLNRVENPDPRSIAAAQALQTGQVTNEIVEDASVALDSTAHEQQVIVGDIHKAIATFRACETAYGAAAAVADNGHKIEEMAISVSAAAIETAGAEAAADEVSVNDFSAEIPAERRARLTESRAQQFDAEEILRRSDCGGS